MHDTTDGNGFSTPEEAQEETKKAKEQLSEQSEDPVSLVGTTEPRRHFTDPDAQSDELLKMAKKIREQAPHGVRLTPLGEKLVWNKGGELIEDEVLSYIPYTKEKSLNVVLHDLMCTLYTAAQYIIKTKRLIPITRDELIKPQKEGGCTTWGYKKGDLQKLEKLDLLKVSHTYLTEKGTGKKVGARVVVYFTPRGRGYIKKFVDKEFMSDVSGETCDV